MLWRFLAKPKAKPKKPRVAKWRTDLTRDVRRAVNKLGNKAKRQALEPPPGTAKADKKPAVSTAQEQAIKATYARATKKPRNLNKWLKRLNRKHKYLPKTY